MTRAEAYRDTTGGLTFRSQLRALTGGWTACVVGGRGCVTDRCVVPLMTSVIVVVEVSAGAGIRTAGSLDGGRLRTGVNPPRLLAVVLRERGVGFSEDLLGALSGVNTCAGTASQVSKSSGALRFFPMVTGSSC